MYGVCQRCFLKIHRWIDSFTGFLQIPQICYDFCLLFVIIFQWHDSCMCLVVLLVVLFCYSVSPQIALPEDNLGLTLAKMENY